MKIASVYRISSAVPLAALVLGCEPASITEARDQLNRGGAASISLSIPVLSDTLTIAEFLSEDDTTTTAGGLLGIPIDSQNIEVEVGKELKFDNLAFDPFTFSYDQLLQTTEVSTSISIPSPPADMTLAPPLGAITFGTDGGSSVVGATIGSGWVVRTMTNGTSCDASVGIEVRDSLGTAVATFPPLPVTAGSVGVDSIDASGATIANFAEVFVTVQDFGVCIPNLGESVATDITFRPLTLAAVQLTNINETFSETYDALASEDRIQAVDTVVVLSGSFDLTFQNRLPIQLALDVEVQGIFRNGTNLSDSVVIPAAPGDGSTTTGTLSFNLASDTIVPSQVVALVNGVASAATGTITSQAVIDAVVVDALGSFEIQSLIGHLDPVQTTELTVDVESFQTITSADFDFDDFEDAIRQSTINDAQATMVITNTSGTPLSLDGLRIGAALIDVVTGEPRRDANGHFILETDTNGNPIAVLIADPGDTSLAVLRNSSKTLDVQIASVADKVIKLAIDGIDAALVTVGTATAGDSSLSRIDRGDIVGVDISFIVGLDLTLPAGGVSFTVNDTEAGGGLDADDADDIAERVVRAGITAEVENGTPFGLSIAVAYVSGDQGMDYDVFTDPTRVELTPITVAGATVDAQGRVLTPTTSQVTTSITGAQARPLLGEDLSISFRVTLLPGTGGGGRGAVRPTDEILLTANAEIEIRRGSP